MSDIQKDDIYVARALEGLEGLSDRYHLDVIEAVHTGSGEVPDHVHYRCLDGTDDRFVLSTKEFEAEYTFVRRPE